MTDAGRTDSRPTAPRRLPASTRWGLVLVACGIGVVFGIARWLDPDSRGYGTHQQLGLPPCHFQWMTGYRCPGCGMTTAFAWFARGRFDRSWQANPVGSVMAPTCLVLIPWLLIGAARGRTPWFESPTQPLTGLVVTTVALSLLSWMIRFFF